MVEETKPKVEETDNSLLDYNPCNVLDPPLSQPIPINIRLEQDIKVFKVKGQNSFKCLLCNRPFGRRDKVKRHLIEHHYGIKDYECSVCLKRFARNEKLIRHMNEVHEGMKGFLCRLCDRRFSRDWEFRHHLKTAHHEQSGLFASGSVLLFDSLSGEQLTNTTNLPSRDESLKVETIDSRYVDQSSTGLFIELEMDTGEQPDGTPKPFECVLCGRAFSRRDLLRRHHQEIHDGIKEYQCFVCSKSFGRKDRLIRHLKNVHQTCKSFVCPSCGREFGQESSYHQHLENVHEHTVNSEPVHCVDKMEG